MFKNWRIQSYIFSEMIPTFLIGLFSLLIIILLFQSFSMVEVLISNGAKVTDILKVFSYISLSYLPILTPTTLFFSVLLTYNRLNSESEITAFKALGLSFFELSIPAILLGLAVSLFSLQTSFYLAPWGHKQLETMLLEFQEKGPAIALKEKVFIEGFFDLVIYASESDKKTNTLKEIFIYQDTDGLPPATIIASEGEMITKTTEFGKQALLRLKKGTIHRLEDKAHTKASFNTFDVRLTDPVKKASSKNKRHIMNQTELKNYINANKEKVTKKRLTKLLNEYNRRWSSALAALIFALIGVGFGLGSQQRSGKGQGLFIGVIITLSYWVLYAGLSNLAYKGLNVLFVAWIPNIVLLIISAYYLNRAIKVR